ncbi:MAG: carboxypeptidase-like regulatory domain-containing protein, partial [Acidobacteriia bacterium]|nr:carboxypeptidase-like regulatory domain-containing protein [Terriglobia bacterium]
MTVLQVSSVIFLTSVCLIAQTDRGAITGTVADASGAIVPGAKIIVENSETQLHLETITTATGNYAVAALPAGTYALTVEQPGFSKYERTNITIQVAVTTRVDVTLAVGQSAESVQVSAD